MIPNTIKSRQLKGDILILGPLGAAALVALYNLLPYINNFLGMLQTGLMRALAIGGMLTVGALLATNFKTILRLGRVISRNITKQFVAIDPIGFLEEIFEDVNDRYKEVQKKAAAIRDVVKSISLEEKEIVEAIERIKLRVQAIKDASQAQVLGRDLERKEASLNDIKAKKANIMLFDKALTKVREILEFRMQDLNSQLEEAKRQQRINKKTEGVVDDIRSILNPGNDDVMWNDAIVQIENQWGETCAEMDLFMEDFKNISTTFDVDGEIAIQRVEELRKKTNAPALQVRVEAPSEDEELNLGIDTSRFKRTL